MSGFWSQRLQQPQVPAPVQQPVYFQPQQQPVVAPPNPYQQVPAGYGGGIPPLPGGQSSVGELIRQEQYTTDKAKSSKQTDRCPECTSGNYMTPPGNDKAGKRCFDCGYNDRFTQSMAGMSGHGQNIPVKTARVQQANVNNFNPQGVFAHI